MPPPGCRLLPSSPALPLPALRARSSVRLGLPLCQRRRRRGVAAMASGDARVAQIASSIRVIPDFPKPGRAPPPAPDDRFVSSRGRIGPARLLVVRSVSGG